jgi:hypothetical protein
LKIEKFLLVVILFLVSGSIAAQENILPQAKVMTLGVFHFDYPNLDFVQTEEKDKISVLEEPYQSEIIAIAKAMEEFKPTIIAVELKPSLQRKMDSLYGLYRAGEWELKENEVYQLGFRIGKNLNLDKVYCVDDPGQHYDNLTSLFKDTLRLKKFSDYYFNSRDTLYELPPREKKISSITDALYNGNNPDYIKERLSTYLLHPFKYEEQPGDFTGVDFESGRWFNRNLRIFRNIQRIPQNPEDRILLIIGSEHLNLLNYFFEVSREYEFISPLPYQRFKDSKIERLKD